MDNEEQSISDLLESAKKPVDDLVFDYTSKQFYRREDGGEEWSPLLTDSARTHVALKGYSMHKGKGMPSEVDREILRLQTKSGGAVAYAGELAGHSPGIYRSESTSFLVTRGASMPTPTPGEWPLIQKFLTGLFGELCQLAYFYGWMKVALEARQKGAIIPGQACVFAGPPGCGKSLLQQRIITTMLGGRSGKPIQYIRGTTTFNKDLTRAEHWVLEDEHASTRIEHRRAFGTAIKEITVNQQHRLHAKGKDAAVSLPLFIRLTVSLNDEPENLMVLPPLDESILDKLMVFHVGGKFDFDIRDPEKRLKFEADIDAEIPHFMHYLLTEWEIAEELKDTRFGIKSYVHPDLLFVFNENAPELQLLELIDTAFFSGGQKDQLVYTAMQLKNALQSSDSLVSYEARQLLRYDSACGAYLARLAGTGRVARLTFGKAQPTKWAIKAP